VKHADQNGEFGCFQRLATASVRTKVRTSAMFFIAADVANT
jgi:hypothetical protein